MGRNIQKDTVKQLALGAVGVALLLAIFYVAIKYAEFVASGLAETLSQLPR